MFERRTREKDDRRPSIQVVMGRHLKGVGRSGPWLLAMLMAGASASSAQTPDAKDTEYVTVWRLSRNDFYQPDFPKDALDSIVKSSPARAITIAEGDTVSGLLKRVFNISQTHTPSVYSTLLDYIKTMNPDLEFSALKPGTSIKLPQLPRTGKTRPGSNPLNLVPTVLDASAFPAAHWSVDKEALTGTPDTVASVGAAAQSELQFFRIPARYAKTYIQEMKRSRAIDEFGASGTVNVVLAHESDQVPAAGFLPAPLAARIRAALSAAAGPATPRPVLVILDDSFPDSMSYAAAKRFVLELSSTLRESYTLGDSPHTDAITKLADTLSPESSKFAYPQLKVHSAMIRRALDDLQALDSKHTIDVVYFPLAATQTEAAPLIQEIVYLGQLLKIYRAETQGKYTASIEQRKKAESILKQLTKDNPKLTSAPLQPFDGTQMTVPTDSMYLESLSIVLKFFSEASRQPHLLSFSWTVPDLQLDTFFQPGAYGWKVTAAGNGAPGKTANVLHDPIVQFAYRGFDPGDFLVVANSDASPDRCPSNTFDDPPDVPVIGLAFSGSLNESFCGTSFSAPRVAWLLAAREVLSKKKVTPADLHSWIADKRTLILGLQRKPPGGFIDRYSFSIEKLLGLSGS